MGAQIAYGANLINLIFMRILSAFSPSIFHQQICFIGKLFKFRFTSYHKICVRYQSINICQKFTITERNVI